MSKIKYSALDQYGAEPFEQQQCVTAGVEGVNVRPTARYGSITAGKA